MGIQDKIDKAKKTKWVTEGFSDSEVKSIVELAKISATIERCRIDMGFTQKEFADYMGVTQGMVSKWESREYNFTIKTLNEICKKIHMELDVSIRDLNNEHPYKISIWENSDKTTRKRRVTNWVKNLNVSEGIA